MSAFAALTVTFFLVEACTEQPENASGLSNKTILVAGGSGRAGSYIVKRLEADGHSFRALTRNQQSAIERLGADYADMNWVEGDARDPARMMEIMQGVDVVISVIGSREREGPNGPEFVDWEGVRNLVDAAVEADVENFVLLTALGASDPEHPLNRMLGDALKWRFKGEEHLRASGLAYTIVRPVGLVHDGAGTRGIYIAQGDQWRDLFQGTIAYDDLASVLIAAAGDPAAHNKTFEITNRDDVDPGLWNVAFDELVTDTELAMN